MFECPKLELIYFDAGGGHRSSANALKESITRQFPLWQVELVNLQEILRPIDPVHRLTDTHDVEDVYNFLLQHEWTHFSGPMLKILHQLIKISARPIERRLEGHWRDTEPDMVGSLIPNFNRSMFRALKRVCPNTPYVTVMTDIADYPPHFWQEKQDQFLVCGSDQAVTQAQRIGYTSDRLFQSSGMILKPKFYNVPRLSHEERRVARLACGLNPDLPTALIMFGGYGSKAAETIVNLFEKSALPVQSIVLCGHNEKLRQALSSRKGCHAVGFIDEVPRFMQLADFFIGKPGPGSVSEAIKMGLPVIIERNQRTMPQERYTATWIKENELGLVVPSFGRIAEAVDMLLKDDRLERMRHNASKIDNQAVFEIPLFFEGIMQKDFSARQASPVRPLKKISGNRFFK